MSHIAKAIAMDNSLAHQFGKVLRKRRLACGLSQQELAFASDLDRTYISLLERGLRQPSLSTIFALSETVGIKPSKLMEEIQSVSTKSG